MVSSKMFRWHFSQTWKIFAVGALVAVAWRYSQTKDKDRGGTGFQYLF